MKNNYGNIMQMHNNTVELEKAEHLLRLSAIFNNEPHKLELDDDDGQGNINGNVQTVGANA